MSSTELNVAWFNQPAFQNLFKAESNSQLNENCFNSAQMRIDLADIRDQSLLRFKRLRKIDVAGQSLFPPNYFQPADDFGRQFLSHAVYASLLDQHISELHVVDDKLLNNSVLGELQTQFYLGSSPEHFFTRLLSGILGH